MSLVCLDAQILIWGVKQQATPGQEGMIRRANDFLEWLNINNYKIIIPAPVITEILMPVPASEYDKVLNLLNKRFRVVPFDQIAAIKCAEIWQLKNQDIILEEYRKTNNIGKHHMKYDYQIAAIAITRQAECIYSHDIHLRKFVDGLITVKEMPIFPTPPQLSLNF